MKNAKDLKQLILQAEDQGWQILKTNGDHLKWVSPTGLVVFSGATPSDRRALKNITRELRVRGFIEIKKKNKR
jgi:predicted RNA binding protein YcfA (HicA-like mRNA interferase family)